MTSEEAAIIIQGGEAPPQIVEIVRPVKKGHRWLARVACVAVWSTAAVLGASTAVSMGCAETQAERNVVCEMNDGFQHGITDGLASLIGKLPGMPDIAPTEPALNPSQPYLG